MAKFELTIYGKKDEVINKFETDKVRWSVFMGAMDLQERIKDKSDKEKFVEINAFMKLIFEDITDEELKNADGFDVINTFKQLLASVQNIKTSKNV